MKERQETMSKYRIHQQLATVVEKNEEESDRVGPPSASVQKQDLIEPVIVKKAKPVEAEKKREDVINQMVVGESDERGEKAD